VHAMEAALGVEVTGRLADLRRLLYCGEWIESHVLHIYMLHAPDFLGYPGAIEMARDHGDVVRRGLALKKVGNEILTLLGGREIHPINVRVGGFYRVPTRRELQPLAERLKWARDAALETVRWVAGFDFPEGERDYELVALSHPDEYPMNRGRIVSNRGLDIQAADFDQHFEETHLARSTALYARLRDRGAYLVGPMARFGLNFDRLSPLAREAAQAAGLGPGSRSAHRSIVTRAVEVLYACDEALRIIDGYDPPEAPCAELEPRAGVGCAATEAPRGLLWHRYRLDEAGAIAEARIVPPTSQNQSSIEADLASFVAGWLDLPDEDLRHRCEQTIRNYDPCISCSTHFLRLELDRG
jgi:coenzyme F420-reducing hydrogenase alpha subunit